MELLLAGAGVAFVLGFREDLNRAIRNTYPNEEKTLGDPSHLFPADAGMDVRYRLANHGRSNYPTSTRTHVPSDNPAVYQFTEPYLKNLQNDQFSAQYANNYSEQWKEMQLPLLRAKNRRNPYNAYRMAVRIRGSPDQHNILGWRFNED